MACKYSRFQVASPIVEKQIQLASQNKTSIAIKQQNKEQPTNHTTATPQNTEAHLHEAVRTLGALAVFAPFPLPLSLPLPLPLPLFLPLHHWTTPLPLAIHRQLGVVLALTPLPALQRLQGAVPHGAIATTMCAFIGIPRQRSRVKK